MNQESKQQDFIQDDRDKIVQKQHKSLYNPEFSYRVMSSEIELHSDLQKYEFEINNKLQLCEEDLKQIMENLRNKLDSESNNNKYQGSNLVIQCLEYAELQVVIEGYLNDDAVNKSVEQNTVKNLIVSKVENFLED